MKLLTVFKYIWNSRSSRERRLLLFALWFILLSSLYLGFINPALNDLKQFKTSIPQAQLTLSTVKRLSEQLNSQPKQEEIVPADLSSMESIQSNLMAVNIESKVSDDPPWKITIIRATGESLFNWLKQNPVDSLTLKRSSKNNDTYWHGEMSLKP